MKSVKEVLFDLAMADIEKQIEEAEQRRNDAIEEAKAHKDVKDSRHNTFKEEALYLAGGLATIIQELTSLYVDLKFMRMQIDINNKVSDGAIVEVKNIDTGVKTKYFLLPAGGGYVYEVNGEQYSTLTIQAPLACSLFGKTKGDRAKITIHGTTKYLLIVSVS